MADVFVSFSTTDTSRVRPLVDGFRGRRLSVFWSNDIPKGAPDYHAIIRHELRTAVLVVVVWTRDSIVSHPVTQECAQAERANKLFQVLFDEIEPIDFPMEVRFRAQKTFLLGWGGDEQNPEWLKLNAAIDVRLAEATQSAEYLLGRGVEHEQRGEYRQAIAEFDQVIENNPWLAEAYYRRAKCHKLLDDEDAALADYQNAARCYSEQIERNPTDSAAYLARSLCHYEYMFDEEHPPGIHRVFGRAMDDCSKAIELNPDGAIAYVERGKLRLRERIYDRALSDFTSAIDKDSNNAKEAYLLRARLLMDSGVGLVADWPKQAIEDFTSAIRIEPASCGAYIERALAYCNLGKEQAAISDFASALRIDFESAIELSEHHLKWLRKGPRRTWIRGVFERAIEANQREPEKPFRMAGRHNGTVVCFDEAEGHGWIKPDGHEKEIYVELSAAAESGLGRLQTGMRVSFEAKLEGGPRLEAVNLRKPT